MVSPRITCLLFLCLSLAILHLAATHGRGEALYISSHISARLTDIFSLYISPPASNFSALCRPHGNQRFQLYMATNGSFGGSLQSVVQVLPEDGGYYNLTVTFGSSKRWDYSFGVLTANYDWYANTYTKVTRVQNGYYVEFQSGKNEPPGNYTINVVLFVKAINSRRTLLDFHLPTSTGLVLLATVAAPLAYFNAFLLVDSYYRGKVEEVTRKRWVGVAAAIVLSALALYILYGVVAPVKGG